MEGVCENIGADKHRSRIVTECQQILRFTLVIFPSRNRSAVSLRP